MLSCLWFFVFFFFNDTATTEIYTLSLHDALPISCYMPPPLPTRGSAPGCRCTRSEEHTSELQSRVDLVCRLLLEKKKTHRNSRHTHDHQNLTTKHRYKTEI